mmetsp:Transcript_34898/g.81620  ORF Transcript_34898/g.81620 Transcript_34898/m.81620 type:complete len:203 (+) Transcript_34898:570-1178(+)
MQGQAAAGGAAGAKATFGRPDLHGAGPGVRDLTGDLSKVAAPLPPPLSRALPEGTLTTPKPLGGGVAAPAYVGVTVPEAACDPTADLHDGSTKRQEKAVGGVGGLPAGRVTGSCGSWLGCAESLGVLLGPGEKAPVRTLAFLESACRLALRPTSTVRLPAYHVVRGDRASSVGASAACRGDKVQAFGTELLPGYAAVEFWTS